jgi:phosphoribosylaminoimidazole-succinocarboxamide synthase
MTRPLTEGSLAGLSHRHLHSGKVRELYAVGDDLVLMVATDRISAFDYVLPTEIADKGAVLTALTLWWFEQLADVAPNHLVAARVADYPAELAPHAEALRGRSMLCRRLDMVPVECVARGYLAGSGLNDYLDTGEVCGHRLPPGLRDGDRLPSPIFTPATKAEMGEHDANVSREEVARTVGPGLADELEQLTLAVYRRATELAEPRGLIVADTKLEFGRDPDGRITLGDEVLTPDSSRFWPADQWEPGHAQPSYDKQYVRDWLLHESGWDRQSPPPALPPEVADRTRQKYVDAYERLTGSSFDGYLRSA